MDNILPFLMLLLAIGGSLISLFDKKNKQEDKPIRKVETRTPIDQKQQSEVSSQRTTSMEDYNNQKQQQLEKLKSNLDVDPKLYKKGNEASGNPLQEVVKLNRKIATKKKSSTRMSIEKNLSKRGLAESIVMAEVLGSPRAKNPYQSKKSMRRPR